MTAAGLASSRGWRSWPDGVRVDGDAAAPVRAAAADAAVGTAWVAQSRRGGLWCRVTRRGLKGVGMAILIRPVTQAGD